MTFEARRDHNSRNADWCDEASGNGQSLWHCRPSELFGGNGEGDFPERSPDYRRCCGHEDDYHS